MLLKIIHPIAAGFFAFLATIIGAKFFNVSETYWYLPIGLLLFSAANYLLYKFKFNSYHVNGSTVTTVLIFTSQISFLGLWKYEKIGMQWLIGVLMIFAGTILL